MIKTFGLGILTLALTAFAAQAQIASDDASQATYQDGWTTSDNGGFGFGAWTVLNQNFIGSSTTNGPSGTSLGIDVAGKSFGLFSNVGAPALAQAARPFATNLSIGQTFFMDFDNGTVGPGGQVGFALRNASNNSLFQFTFSGGDNFYVIDSATTQITAHGFTADGMTTSFTLLSATTFQFSIRFNDNSTTETFTGSLAAPGGAITNFRLFATNPNDTNSPASKTDVFFNNMIVVPEPSSLALLTGPALLGGWFFLRRRRS